MIQSISSIGCAGSNVAAAPLQGAASSSISLQGSSSLDVYRAALIGLLLAGKKDEEKDHSCLLAGLLMMGMAPGGYYMEFSQTWANTGMAATFAAAGAGGASFNALA